MATTAKFDFSRKFVEKTGGDPIKGMGLFTIICGCCPCTVACTFMGFYAALFAVAATYTRNYTDFLEGSGEPTDVNFYD